MFEQTHQTYGGEIKKTFGHVDTRFRGYQSHRSCDRPGCGLTATATLTYDYAGHTVWIDNLTEEAHPATYDLCSRHTERATGPRGWDCEDRRTYSTISNSGSNIFANAS